MTVELSLDSEESRVREVLDIYILRKDLINTLC